MGLIELVAIMSDGGSRCLLPARTPLVKHRSVTKLLGTLGLASLLAGCGPSGSISPSIPDVSGAPTIGVESQALPGLDGNNVNQIGSGPVRVGLILPLTGPGGTPSVVGTALRNAAELAVSEAGSQSISLLVKDDQSAPAGAQAAAQLALNEGAELIVGPLFSPNVREVGRLARSAGKPVIAFSTDTSTATRGVYLLSFLVEGYVDRVMDYAASKGRKSIAALIPDNDYGRVAEAEFQAVAARDNIRVQQIEHYKPGASGAAVQKIAANLAQIDGLFIAEAADGMPAIATQMQSAGIDGRKISILGTGLWNDARVLKLPALQGALFASPENAGFNSFAQRYRAKYGSDPTRVATLAYDAVSLAAALARTQGAQRFSEGVLTAPSGFNGTDGVFRFRADGQNERGLSVLEINAGTTSTASPSPKSFGAGGT